MQYQLAQLNIARMQYTYEDLEMEYFVRRLEPVNAMADISPGFVWRLQTDESNEAEFTVFDDAGYLVNMSVWESLEDLSRFVRTEIHMDVMKRRREWFVASDQATFALWWVSEGHIPDIAEAQSRLEHLRTHGASTRAFTFREPFPPPDLTP